jgi:hypothetical protein
MPQTTVTSSPSRALAGALDATNPHEIVSTCVDVTAGIAPGLVVLRTEGGDSAAGFPSSIGADDDAILTALATAAAIQTLDAEADGVIGTGRIWPPAKLSVTRSAHADQNAVTAVLSYLDENGLPRSENLAFADAGGDSFTSAYYASRFVSLVIPAQAGVGGTTQIGITADRTLDGGDVLGVSVLDVAKTLEVSPSSWNNEVYEDATQMPALRKGRINVTVENAFRSGDCPLVRFVAAGAEKLGAIRVHDTDGGDCIAWRRARLMSSGSAGEVGILEVNLP